MIDTRSRSLWCWFWNRSCFGRLARNSQGMESVEVALGIALVAAIAGFGMVLLGDALATWFETAASAINQNTAMPPPPTTP